MGLQQHTQILKDHIQALNSRFIMEQVNDIEQELELLEIVIKQTKKHLPIHAEITHTNQLEAA